MSNDPENPIPAPPIREFYLGPTHFRQQGRITEINHPVYGQTYLVDVTDQEDLSDQTPDNQGDIIREMFGRELFDSNSYETYSRNNGSIAAISTKLSSDQKPRVYLGQDISFDEEGHPDLTSTLVSLSFQERSYYVPMSIEPELYIFQVMKAERELGPHSPFIGVHKKFIPKDPNPDDFYEKGGYKE